MRRRLLCPTLATAWALLAICPLVQTKEPRHNDEHGYAFFEFANDLFAPWSDASPYPSAHYSWDYVYKPVESLPKRLQARVNAAVPGLTRERLEQLGWGENGGPAIAEFLLVVRRGVVDSVRMRARYVALRIALRPAAMPAEVYADSAQRRAWLREHRPDPGPCDVVMRVSRPFLDVSISD